MAASLILTGDLRTSLFNTIMPMTLRATVWQSWAPTMLRHRTALYDSISVPTMPAAQCGRLLREIFSWPRGTGEVSTEFKFTTILQTGIPAPMQGGSVAETLTKPELCRRLL